MAMRKIGIIKEQRKKRNIVFHSLRHYCATQIAQRTSLEIAMKILGHRTEEMTRLYSEHETKVNIRIVLAVQNFIKIECILCNKAYSPDTKKGIEEERYNGKRA